MDKVLLLSDVVARAPERWASQYKVIRGRPRYPDKEAMTEKLLALTTVTKEAVDAIISNTSWTEIECNECKKCVDAVFIFGNECGDYAHYACKECLLKAASEIDKERNAR